MVPRPTWGLFLFLSFLGSAGLRIFLSDFGIQLLIRLRKWDRQAAVPPELTGMCSETGGQQDR